tara:strand:- start:14138 stop:15244 length:1107 start_codon:yes stop_codon:yes gene_type:complete
MRYITIILLLVSQALYSQAYDTDKLYDDLFRFATFYASTSLQNPITPDESFTMDSSGTLYDVTERRKFDYNITLGIRRIARYEYDYKDDEFYDGSEQSISTASNVGAINGLEYNIKYNFVRDEGDVYSDNEIWVRFSQPYFMIKASYQDNQMIDLKYTDITLRGRYNLGKFNFTAGGSYRNHPVYGYDPIADWVSQNSWWGPLAYKYGYTDEHYEIHDGHGAWKWFNPDGVKIAESDDEFYKYYYGDIVAQYNEDVLDSLGMQGEISAVVGVDFYTYEENFWMHSWLNVYPYHYGISKHSFDYYNKHGNHHQEIGINKIVPKYIDFDIGLILGFKLKKNFGFFIEGQYTRFWHIPHYQFKTGINFMFR